MSIHVHEWVYRRRSNPGVDFDRALENFLNGLESNGETIVSVQLTDRSATIVTRGTA